MSYLFNNSCEDERPNQILENQNQNSKGVKMAETSKLAKIETVPLHPMQMFDDVLAETKKIQIVPFEVMCVASINE